MGTVVTTAARRIARTMKSTPQGWWVRFDDEGQLIASGAQSTWPPTGLPRCRWVFNTYAFCGPWTQRAVQEEMDRQDGWARMEAAL